MAKRNTETLDQVDLFNFDPAITKFSVVDVKLRAGAVDVSMVGATEARDLAMIQSEHWARAAAEWLMRLTDGDINRAESMVLDAHADFLRCVDGVTVTSTIVGGIDSH